MILKKVSLVYFLNNNNFPIGLEIIKLLNFDNIEQIHTKNDFYHFLENKKDEDMRIASIRNDLQQQISISSNFRTQ